MHRMVEKANPAVSSAVLTKAALNAAKALELRQSDLAAIVGRARSRLHDGMDPASKSGELALMFVRVYRALYAQLGGDRALMARWVRTENRGTGGVPAEQMRTVDGLARVLAYLDAMRGKV